MNDDQDSFNKEEMAGSRKEDFLIIEVKQVKKDLAFLKVKCWDCSSQTMDTIHERLPTRNLDKQSQDSIYPNNASTKSFQNIDDEMNARHLDHKEVIISYRETQCKL